ncbi:MAG: type II toxin-antitoxin system HipA family toxin [Pseudohongiellaceae bacterium]
MNQEILVYIDIQGQACPVGRLWSRSRSGRETASFEYDSAWLEHPQRFALDPVLTLGSGTFHTPLEKTLFGAFDDSTPDRWGRTLMRRAERRRAEAENQTPRTLAETDFLLLVDDEARQGALRFKTDLASPFLAPEGGRRIPPLVDLPRLLSAAERVANNEDADEDLKLLIAPGSSLGGARPKASIRDRHGHLALAKFPHGQDDFNVVLWESVALTLALKAGITVPQQEIVMVDGKAVILIHRFDRVDGERIPFLSAMSMLGANDNETHSYLEIADALRQHGGAPQEDLEQLWRRIVFNILISNTDDHLRNHGFLYGNQQGWRLSPAYDLNPVPVDVRPRILSTTIDTNDPAASIDLALETAEHYGLTSKAAQAIVREVGQAVTDWRKEATRLGIKPREVERMASAFEHDDGGKATQL